MSTHAPTASTGGRSASSAVIVAIVAAVLVTGAALAARGLTAASADSALTASAKARAALDTPTHSKAAGRLMAWHAPKVPKAPPATYGAPTVRTIYVAQHTTAPAPQTAPAPTTTTSGDPADDSGESGGGDD
jgi:hypothetical protein